MRVRQAARRPVRDWAAGLLLYMVLLWGSQALGESRFVFPRLAEGLQTRLVLANPTAADAEITLSAYGPQGELLSGLENPVGWILPQHQQLTLPASELFGPGSWPEAAWVEAVSPADDLVGSVLHQNPAVTFLDGNDLPGLHRQLLFHQVRLGGGERTRIHLINPSDRPASVQLQLQDHQSAPRQETLEIPARALSPLDLDEFFGIEALSPGSYLRADSETPMAGFALIRTPEGDGFGVNARDGETRLTDCGLWIQPRCSYALPQLAVLGPWRSELGLVNGWHLPAIVILSAFAPDGLLYDENHAARNPVTLQLEPGESLLEDTAGLFGFHGTQPLDGYIQVESTSPALAGYLNYGLPANGSRSSLMATARPTSRALFSGLFTPEALFTGVALLNPGTLASNVRILELASDGDVLESFQTVLQPGQRLARLMESVGLPDSGMIWIRSDLPLYMTSILAGDSALADLPPQSVPETYLPDEGLPSLEMKPPLAIVQPGGTQQFYLSGNPLQVTWRVNGISGGNATVGTIDANGIFTAPADIPTPQVVTVTAQGEGRTTGASVDVLGKETLFTSNRVLQSVTYLESNQALYTAELTLMAASSRGMLSMGTSGAAPSPAARAGSQGMAARSEIFETRADLGKVPVADFNNEIISKIIPYPAASGGEFLLLAAQSTGRILRLDPASREVREILSGLDEPSALVVDPRSGDLLVAERDRITTIERSLLEPQTEPASALTPSGLAVEISASGPRTVVDTPAPGGVAVDNCTGNLYFTDSEQGIIYEFSRRRQELREVASGFREPGQLLAVYRRGVGCPDSFQLLVSDRISTQVTVLVPRMGFSGSWYSAQGNTDLTFLSRGNPFASSHEAVVLTELTDSGEVLLSSQRNYSLAVVEVPDLYRQEPENETQAAEDEASGEKIRKSPINTSLTESSPESPDEETGSRDHPWTEDDQHSRRDWQETDPAPEREDFEKGPFKLHKDSYRDGSLREKEKEDASRDWEDSKESDRSGRPEERDFDDGGSGDEDREHPSRSSREKDLDKSESRWADTESRERQRDEISSKTQLSKKSDEGLRKSPEGPPGSDSSGKGSGKDREEKEPHRSKED